MRRELVERCREPEHLVGVDLARGGHDIRDSVGRPWVRVPVLSKSTTRPAASRSSAAAALDDDAAVRGPRQTRHDRDRGGQQERAGGRHDEDRHRPDRVARDAPRRSPARARVRGTKSTANRSAVRTKGADDGLGLLDEADDTGVRRLGRQRRREDLDGTTRVDDTAADLVARRPLDREGLPGEGRLVEDGAVERGARRPGRPPPCRRRGGRRARRRRPAPPRCGHRAVGEPTGGTRDEQTELASCAGRCPGFEEPSRRQHHRDHRARERLADGEGAGQGEHGDDVDRGLAPAQRGHRPDEGGHEPEHGAGDPGPLAGPGCAEQPRRTAGDEEGQGGEEQHQSGPLAEPSHGSMLSPGVGATRTPRRGSPGRPRRRGGIAALSVARHSVSP